MKWDELKGQNAEKSLEDEVKQNVRDLQAQQQLHGLYAEHGTKDVSQLMTVARDKLELIMSDRAGGKIKPQPQFADCATKDGRKLIREAKRAQAELKHAEALMDAHRKLTDPRYKEEIRLQEIELRESTLLFYKREESKHRCTPSTCNEKGCSKNDVIASLKMKLDASTGELAAARHIITEQSIEMRLLKAEMTVTKKFMVEDLLPMFQQGLKQMDDARKEDGEHKQRADFYAMKLDEMKELMKSQAKSDILQEQVIDEWPADKCFVCHDQNTKVGKHRDQHMSTLKCQKNFAKKHGIVFAANSSAYKEAYDQAKEKFKFRRKFKPFKSAKE
jgi:hypothetical protein